MEGLLNQTIEITKKLSYEEITHVTQSIPFFVIVGFIWLVIGLILYLVIAGSIRARTSSGVKLKSSMLSHGNAWIPVIIGLIQGIFIMILLIFPFWARLF